MEEYYFLFALAFVWIIFAVFQDSKTREISNWLNFSLIAFVLAYRIFYSIYSKNVNFFLFGLGGVLLFVLIGYICYYGKLFAGGDAKLLMGLGGILPYQNLMDYLYLGMGFIFLLFLVGAIYTLIYSGVLVLLNKKQFTKEFKSIISKFKLRFYFSISMFLVLIIILIKIQFSLFIFALAILSVTPLIYFYSKAIENSCMIKLVSPNKLTEGDWLEKDVKIGNKYIKKSVHGLSKRDIEFLKKKKKKVWIKEGIPFSPAFLISFLLMVFFFLV
jgi:Flp pilus assembly protein protease CpaA|tara:strand:- start:98 stop:916 length:819 start_codon:yes stop_codon:yes gene_type:complete